MIEYLNNLALLYDYSGIAVIITGSILFWFILIQGIIEGPEWASRMLSDEGNEEDEYLNVESNELAITLNALNLKEEVINNTEESIVTKLEKTLDFIKNNKEKEINND